MSEVPDGEDRYSRFRLIPWWQQSKITNCRLLVIGAGALGNEILKNAALLGFSQVVIIDLDRIEESNLSRTILFKNEDIGNLKAVSAAKAYQAIAPGAKVQPIVTNVLNGCGLGLLEWSDVILAGLDNREARLWINRGAWKMNRPWIDGAIEGINGVVRVFLPGVPPCYECTLGEVDWILLQKRMSCNLLALEAAADGKVPTTPTISAVIAGIQVQEAVKLVHGLPTLAGKGYVFEGMNHTSYVVRYTENPECLSHYVAPSVVHLQERSEDLTLEDLRQRAQADLGLKDILIEFSRDVVQKLVCPSCGAEEEKFAAAESIAFASANCPNDGQLRTVFTVHSYRGEEETLGSRRLSELGLPLLDGFIARDAEHEILYVPSGDIATLLPVFASVTATP